MIAYKELEAWTEQSLVDMRAAINMELERRSQESMKQTILEEITKNLSGHQIFGPDGGVDDPMLSR
jgi:hypothetical protein